MEHESPNYISFMEALEASREIDEYYASGRYFEDMKDLRNNPEAVEEFLAFYEAVCKA